MGSAATGTWFILTVEVPRTLAEEIAGWVREALGIEPVEVERAGMPDSWLDLYYASEVEAEIAARTLTAQFPITAWHIRSLQDRDWQTFWRAHFRTQEFGERLLLVPSWEEPDNAAGRVCITLEPGMSFGTGDHFTTRFCLEMIDRLFTKESPVSFLDVGTGSGILAIAAARLGCARVMAVEHDAVSLQSARENAAANGVSDRIEFVEHDIRNGWPHGSFDVVCANLFGSLLVEVAPTLMSAADKCLVLTGIMEREADYVADCYIESGAGEQMRDGNGEWVGLLLEV